MTTASSPTPPPFRVTIVGAGLSGTLTALLLSRLTRRRAVEVTLVDLRADPRAPPARGDAPRGRSINLALSTRGLSALARAGLDDAVRAIGVPMHARCVHHAAGATSRQPYGRPGEFLLSVSRRELGVILVRACAERENVRLVFGAKVMNVDIDAGRVEYSGVGGGGVLEADLVIGADGTYSRVRAAMERRVPRFDSSREHISAAYKELHIPQDAAVKASLPREVLHIWPRRDFMLIALPNKDGSFTSTLFMDAVQLERLEQSGSDVVSSFFAEEFPDATRLLPDVAAQFLASPTPPLLTVRCRPYNWKGRALLIGDAAHAIVPFYGQGCNAAFEDCVRLYDTVRQWSLDEIEGALNQYSDERKKDADAIAALAVEHYEDMASKSASILCVARRRLEIFLHSVVPSSFVPLYSMVTFSNVPYSEAVQRAKEQDKFLTCAGAAAALAAVIASASALKGVLSKGSMRSC